MTKASSTIAMALVLSALSSGAAMAQAQTQSGGQQAAPTVTKSLGLTQDAWNARLRARGESRTNPGYVRYVYDPANVFPVRTRESMITTIKLPETDRLTQAFPGDDQGFQVGLPTPNSIAIKALYPGVDTNIVAFTEEGRVYTFYVRSEGYNSKTISDFLVDVVNAGPNVIEGGSMGVGGQPATGFSVTRQATRDGQYPADAAERIRDPYSTNPVDPRAKFRDYAEWTDFDPSTVVDGDLGVYVPKDQAGGTIPYRVFHDDRFTYVDYGPNASQMTEWPTPVIVIQGVEGPVGFRTVGPGGRLMVMEALGNFVLRNGQRTIVVKRRSDGNPVTQGLIEYPVASSGPMAVPTDLPPGRPGALVSRPRTAVPDETRGMTANGEAPSRVVTPPQTREIRADKPGKGRDATRTRTTVTEVAPPAPATPVRTVEVTSKVGAAATMAMESALTGVARPTTATTVARAPAVQPAPARAAPAATPTAVPSPAPAPAPGTLVPKTDASALAGYKVVVGRGTPAELEDRWKSYKVQYYSALNGRRMAIEPRADGGSAMSITPIDSIATGMRICSAIADGSECTVRAAR